MRLGIDAREIQDGVYTGIGRSLVNFLRYFAAQDNEDSCVLFTAKSIPINFGSRVSQVIIPASMTIIWDQWHLPQAIKKAGIDVFYSPYYKIPLLKPCKTISAILDLMYLAFEPYYRQMSPAAKLYYAVFGRLYAKRADKILTCSQYSKKDIERIYGVEEQKIRVIPLSVGDIYHPENDPIAIDAMKKKLGIKGPYLLYVGNFKVHKNVKNVIDAFAAIADLFPDLHLVLAGPKEHCYQELMVQAVRYNQFKDRIIFADKITEKDQPHILYSGAATFVMPTLYEGFGLPPLEAMACGVPVIASNTTSIPEVVGDAGILVDPYKVVQIATAISTILKDQELAKKCASQGLIRAKAYKSENIEAQMYAFLKN